MRRILLVFIAIVLLLLLTACDAVSQKEYPEPVVVLPNDIMAETVNGYKALNNDESSSVDSESKNESESKFFGNKSTKKYHKKDCRYAKNMNEEKLVIFESQSQAFESGFSPCKVCFSD